MIDYTRFLEFVIGYKRGSLYDRQKDSKWERDSLFVGYIYTDVNNKLILAKDKYVAETNQI